MTVVNGAGQQNDWNLTYGSYFYDSVLGYIDVKDNHGATIIQLRTGQITEYNGVSGSPTYEQLLIDLYTAIRE